MFNNTVGPKLVHPSTAPLHLIEPPRNGLRVPWTKCPRNMMLQDKMLFPGGEKHFVRAHPVWRGHFVQGAFIPGFRDVWPVLTF